MVLIDHFNGIEAATSFLSRTKGRAAVSVITRAGVLTGFSREREPLALRLLDRFATVEIGVAAADPAARLCPQTLPTSILFSPRS